MPATASRAYRRAAKMNVDVADSAKVLRADAGSADAVNPVTGHHDRRVREVDGDVALATGVVGVDALGNLARG